MHFQTRTRYPQSVLRIIALVAILGGVLGMSGVAEADIFLPVIRQDCVGLSNQTIFGIQVYGATDVNSMYHSYFTDLGASWIRNQLEWKDVEPADVDPAQYTWSVADATVAAAADSCLNVVLTHLSSPSWAATKPEGPIDKVPLSEFAEYLGALTERYDGDGVADAPNGAIVTHIELYNEPDAMAFPNGGRWGDNGADYGAMLKAVYPAIKAANANTQVVFGGIAYDGFTDAPGGTFVRRFLDDVLAVPGVGDAFDIMNVHIYPAFAKDWTGGGPGPGLKEKTEFVRKKLTDVGINKPFFITELGWHNNNPPEYPSNDEIQSRFVVELYTQSIVADVEMGTWWLLIDSETYPYNTGLVTALPPQTKKVAYSVFKIAISELATAQFNRTLPQSETNNADLEVHQFDDGGQTLYVAWLNPVNTSANAPLRLNAASVTVRDMFGASNTVLDQADGNQDGKVTLTIQDPVYIRVVQ